MQYNAMYNAMQYNVFVIMQCKVKIIWTIGQKQYFLNK